MDLSKMTDINELKALAYDLLQLIERDQNNLRLVQQRIEELSQQPETQQKKK